MYFLEECERLSMLFDCFLPLRYYNALKSLKISISAINGKEVMNDVA